MDSSYFSDGRFRGVHKNYYYWFTGLNTQVLHYEQSYNNVYVAVAGPIDLGQGIDLLQSGDQKNSALGLSVGIGDPTVSRQYAAQTTQQAKNDANTPAATAADFLYSAADQNNVTIRIVGDPAWLLQGEIIGFQKLCFDGFWPNGAVVTETQEAVFAINFNTPADYNNGTSGPNSGTG
jgi:hypothetical protein